MKKILILTFFLSFSAFGRKSAQWDKITKLLDVEIKSLQNRANRTANLKYRLIEIYFEKMKLIREKENALFLSGKVSKKRAFDNSRKMNKLIQREGLYLVKKWPSFAYTPNLYYTLGLSARDYGEDERTFKKYFQKALRDPRSTEGLKYGAHVGLAEYNYNKKNYRKAISHYKHVVKKTEDTWVSRHFYNLSWCFLKVNKFNTAVAYLNRSFIFSKKKGFQDMSDQVLASAGLFYGSANRIKEGVDFYIKNSDESYFNLIKMAKSSLLTSKNDDKRYILEKALEEAIKKSSLEGLYSVYAAQLELFRSTQKYQEFFNVAKKINNLRNQGMPDESLKDDVVQKISNLVNFLQNKLFKGDKDPKSFLVNEIITYFDILSNFNPEMAIEYKLFQSETHFTVGRFLDSLKYSKKGIVLSKKSKKEEKSVKKIFDVMFASLEKHKPENKKFEPYFYFTYIQYIRRYPKDEVAKKLYVKLFNLYFNAKNYKKAAGVIKIYNKNVKTELIEQKAMMVKVINHYIKTKDTRRLMVWMNKIAKGFLSFEKKYKEELVTVLGELVFGDLRVAENQKKYDYVIQESQKILGDALYPKRIKGDAVLNIAHIYNLKLSTELSYTWLQKSFKFFTAKELDERISSYLNIALRYGELQDFNSSKKIADLMLIKSCKSKRKYRNDFFQIASQVGVLENANFFYQYDKIAKKCNISQDIIKQYTQEYLSQISGNERRIRQAYKTLGSRSFTKEIFAESFETFYWKAFYQDSDGNNKKTNYYLAKLGELDSQKVLNIKLMNEYRKSIKAKSFSINGVSKDTDFKLFEKDLNHLMSSLELFNNKSKDILKNTKSGDVAINIYAGLENIFKKGRDAISLTLKTKISKEFKTEMIKQLSPLISQLDNQISGFQIEINKTKESESTLVYYAQYSKENKDYRYPAHLFSLPIDSGKGEVL